MKPCDHPEIRQISTIIASTTWTRGASGAYLPDEEINEVIAEDTQWWECIGCGEHVLTPRVD